MLLVIFLFCHWRLLLNTMAESVHANVKNHSQDVLLLRTLIFFPGGWRQQGAGEPAGSGDRA